MRTDKYYSASAEIAERGGFTEYRKRLEGGRFLLSESDIRRMVSVGILEIEELKNLDIIEVSKPEADLMALEESQRETQAAAGVQNEDSESSEAEPKKEDVTEEEEINNEQEGKEQENGKKHK